MGRLKPAVCPSCLILTHSQVILFGDGIQNGFEVLILRISGRLGGGYISRLFFVSPVDEIPHGGSQ